MAGPLFRQLAEDMSRRWSPSLLFTGHPDTLNRHSEQDLLVREAPAYNRNNYLTRLLSWLSYFFATIKLMTSEHRGSLLFIVSNPPFLGLTGFLFKILRGQNYVMLVYDIYPDVLVNSGRIVNGLLAKFWDAFNRLIYKHAKLVMTIDTDMAMCIQKKIRASSEDGRQVVTISPWADVQSVKPIPKGMNPFVQQNNLNYRTIVLYSGNMGHTHRIEPILDAARELFNNKDIHFLFVGEGEKYKVVEDHIKKFHLKNITLLPFQPENVLPYSMAAGDIGVAAYEKGTQGCILPSKTFYYMSAGLVPLIISDQPTALTKLLQKNDCGIRVVGNDSSCLVKTILQLHQNREKLNQLQTAARRTAVALFSRDNTARFEAVLMDIGF
jgi:glycosyltransferase involved in cell wall biosynthesis